MENIKKLWILAVAFAIGQTGMWGATRFSLPECMSEAQKTRDTRYPKCLAVNIPNSLCSLYFPDNGTQPDTQLAGLWSGARCAKADNNAVTAWWIRIFGGDQAVVLSGINSILLRGYEEIPMGFTAEGRVAYIINVTSNTTFQQQFWKTFRLIAEDPVGRVLLYRLLIEIRRMDDRGRGCCEGNIITTTLRNNNRSIEIKQTNEGCSFCASSHCINFDLHPEQTLTLHEGCIPNSIVMKPEARPLDIALFHEMLHWFHYLRNSARISDNKKSSGFMYVLRCYYGDQCELDLWSSELSVEDIATILGSPNYNQEEFKDYINRDAFLLPGGEKVHPPSVPFFSVKDMGEIPVYEKFLAGDDLSEILALFLK